MEIFVDEVMFYQLTDLLLEKTPEEIAEETCRKRLQTFYIQLKSFIYSLIAIDVRVFHKEGKNHENVD